MATVAWGCSTDSALSPNAADGPSSRQNASDSSDPSNDDSLALTLDGDADDGSTDNGTIDAANLDGAGSSENSGPIANAGEDLRVISGQTVLLDGGDSVSPDQDPLTFDWAQGEGDVRVELSSSADATATFVAPAVESETVLVFALTVSNTQGKSQDTVNVFVSPAELAPPCPQKFTLVAANTSGLVPLSVTFELALSSETATLDGVASWFVDDEVVGEGPTLDHRFSSAGQYTVEACLTTTCGFEDATRCDSVRIDVNEPEAPPPGGGLGGGPPPPPPPPPTTNTAPIAVAEAPATTPEFTVVKLGGSKSEDPDNGPQALTYAWKQTAGTDVTGDSLYSSTAMDPQFTAPAFANNTTLDNLTFQLIVYDGADYSPTNSATISITDTVVTPQNRTAALPDSWLVLYNVNSADSIAWKDWYIQQWGIPAENTLGLNADANLERILKADMIDDIFTPVVNYLNANPSVKAKVMGILVGYRVPGNYYTDANTPYLQGGGGWSVSSRLQKLDATLLNIQNWPQNSHFFAAYFLPDPVRITKATLGTNVYLSARIDAPTLADAKSLTTRARTISANTSPLPATESVYIDYDDVGAAGGNEWATLRLAYEDVDFNNPAWRFPWRFFESDGGSEEPTPNCAFRFSYYRLTGWQNADWSGSPTGTRILGYALNSWGATTVRSTTAHSGRYVPNLLFNGGFAGAVGATGEPYLSSAPKADTMLWCLAEGWTMGEATFRATPAHAWMWELVGDPLLRVPSWFPSP